VAGKPDLAEVYRWWTLAALQGHPQARQALDVVTPKLGGDGLARAQAEVAEWLQRTAGDASQPGG
jgi:hypothetical protein